LRISNRKVEKTRAQRNLPVLGLVNAEMGMVKDKPERSWVVRHEKGRGQGKKQKQTVQPRKLLKTLEVKCRRLLVMKGEVGGTRKNMGEEARNLGQS
jgi:hypothetical protein